MGHILSKIQDFMIWLVAQYTNRSRLTYTPETNEPDSKLSTVTTHQNLDAQVDLLALVPPISIFENSSLPFDEKSIRDLNKQNATFMWSQLLIETLIRMPLSDQAKNDLLVECRQRYHENESELGKIVQFSNDCSPTNCIRWYTRDCFLYRLLNQAFRTENIDEILKFRFFIRQLNEQICSLHKDYVDILRSIEYDSMTVYRGQTISADELQKLRDNIGGLIAFNTFLSTTIDNNVAKTYAGDGSREPEYFCVLFEITVDIENSTAFTDIRKHSHMRDEGEVLFSMSSVFRIVSVEDPSNDKLTTVKLISSKEEDERLICLINHFKKQLDQSTNLLTLGAILKEMGDYGRAERYYQLMLQESVVDADQMELAELYNNLGCVISKKGNHQVAFQIYEKALDIYLKDGAKPRPSAFASLYNNMGQACFELGEYEEASKAYNVALNTMTKFANENHPGFAIIYSNLADLYVTCGKYSAAMDCLNKSLELEQRILPNYHPSLGTTYNNRGRTFMCLGDHSAALVNFQKAWEIEHKCLPPFHPNLASTQNNIGICCYYADRDALALQHFEQALRIQANAACPVEEILAKTYSNIGMLYEKRSQNDVALKYCEKAHAILVKILSTNDPFFSYFL